jgi:predicted Zn finger-like uncharacterized protein
MPEVIIRCPQCERQLRVPDEMIGRLVRCPTCGMTFTLASGGAPPQPAAEPPAVLPAGPPPEEPPYADALPVGRRPAAWAEYPDDDEQARSAVRPPAICLLIVGLLGMSVNALILTAALVIGPDAEPFQQARANQDPAAFGAAWTVTMVMIGGFAFMSLLVVVGAIQMLRTKAYGFAIISSILAMLIIYPGCCVIGLPVGLWSLLVLLRQDVRAVFG